MSEVRCDHCNLCLKETGPDSCRLCGKASYCGDQCAQNDWANHIGECAVLHVSDKNVLVAAPYIYSDVLPAKYFEPGDIEMVDKGHLLVHAERGIISTRVADSLISQEDHPEVGDEVISGKVTVGAKKFIPHCISCANQEVPSSNSSLQTSSFDKNLRYYFAVNGLAVSAIATLKNDVISPKSPGPAGKLAQGRVNVQANNLWTPLTKKVDIEIPNDEVRISVMDAATKKELDGVNVVFAPDDRVMTKISRKARGPISGQLLEKKLTGTELTAFSTSPDNQGRIIRLIRDGPKLVDIEYQLPRGSDEEEDDWISQQITCDARDVDHVAGLLAVVAQRVEEDETNAGLAADYRTIHDHLEKLQSGITNPSPSVNAAINRQLEEIGIGLYGRREVKFRDVSLPEVKQEVDTFIGEVDTAVAQQANITGYDYLASIASARRMLRKWRLGYVDGKVRYKTNIAALQKAYPDLKKAMGQFDMLNSTKTQRTFGSLQKRKEISKQGGATRKKELDAAKREQTDRFTAGYGAGFDETESKPAPAASQVKMRVY